MHLEECRDGHLFVDGAARSNLVVPGFMGQKRPGPPLQGPGNIYVIDNGKLSNPPEALRRAIGDVAATTVATMMSQSMQTAIFRMFVGARALGYNFKLVAIEPHVKIGKDPLEFDPQQMRPASNAARALARQPSPWADHTSGDQRPAELGGGACPYARLIAQTTAVLDIFLFCMWTSRAHEFYCAVTVWPPGAVLFN